MFSMHNFVKKTVIGMIGREPEYKVRQFVLSWLEKDVLSQDDLAAIDAAYPEPESADEYESDSEPEQVTIEVVEEE
jgi:hypothetical protein